MAGELADVVAGTAPTDPLAIAPQVKGSIRILIVEDDRTLREGLLITLRAEGYNVSSVNSGDEALESIKRTRYDIIRRVECNCLEEETVLREFEHR